MNHTPTPTPTPYAYRMEGDSMAIIFHQTPTGEQRITRTASVLGEDNAAFIVQACNAHEALVKAATDLLAYLPLSSDGFQVQLEDALIEALQFAGADIKVTTGE